MMRKYVACVAIAAAATLIVPAVAGAHAPTIMRAQKGKMDLLFLGKSHARREYYVQRVASSTSAQAASSRLAAGSCLPSAAH